MLIDGKIKATTLCPVFSELLVYFFYGRPAYKVSVAEDQRVTDEYLPIALIFEGSAISNISRIFPFDTGAFPKEAYKPALHKDVDMTEFQVDPTLEAAQRIVAAFFGSNDNYVLGDPTSTPPPNFFDEPEAFAHRYIIDGAVKIGTDDRRYTVELQTKDEIALAGELKAVIVPHTMLTSKTLQNFLRANPKVEHPSYSHFRGATISSLHTVILERVREYLNDHGYL